MSTPCIRCNGNGLLSTGANPQDLSVGRKETCPDCAGRGQIFTVEEVKTETASSQSGEDPKVEGAPEQANENPSGGASSESSEIVPREGDSCRMDDDSNGVLAKSEEGAWICIPKPEQV